MTVHYIADADVDAELDRRIRSLLSTCFTKPEDWVFRERRYFNDPPAHRWYIDAGRADNARRTQDAAHADAAQADEGQANEAVRPQETLAVSETPQDDSELWGHIALHERSIVVGEEELACGGVSEVAVHPNARGRGIAKLLVSTVHDWMASRPFDFSVLFGDPAVYASSGYRAVGNPIRYRHAETGEVIEQRFGTEPGTAAFMYYPVGNRSWPDEDRVVDLQGRQF